MGYYIQTPVHFNKAYYLVEEDEAEIINQPTHFSDISKDRALICVVTNPLFEAAGYCFCNNEFTAFLPTPEDQRPRTWLTMPLEKAQYLSGFRKD